MPRRKKKSKPTFSNFEPRNFPTEQKNLYGPWMENPELTERFEPWRFEYQIPQEHYQFQQEPRYQRPPEYWVPWRNAPQNEILPEVRQSSRHLITYPSLMPDRPFSIRNPDAEFYRGFSLEFSGTTYQHSKVGPSYPIRPNKLRSFRNRRGNMNLGNLVENFSENSPACDGSARKSLDGSLENSLTLNGNPISSVGRSSNNSQFSNGNHKNFANHCFDSSPTSNMNHGNSVDCSLSNSPTLNIRMPQVGKVGVKESTYNRFTGILRSASVAKVTPVNLPSVPVSTPSFEKLASAPAVTSAKNGTSFPVATVSATNPIKIVSSTALSNRPVATASPAPAVATVPPVQPASLPVSSVQPIKTGIGIAEKDSHMGTPPIPETSSTSEIPISNKETVASIPVASPSHASKQSSNADVCSTALNAKKPNPNEVDDVLYLYTVQPDNGTLVEVLDLSEDEDSNEISGNRNLVLSSRNPSLCNHLEVSNERNKTSFDARDSFKIVPTLSAEKNKGSVGQTRPSLKRKREENNTTHCVVCDSGYEDICNNANLLFSAKCGHLFCVACLKNLSPYKCTECNCAISNLRKVIL